MTGVEAMLCQTIVLASDIPVHKEVYNNFAKYFNAQSFEDLYDNMKKVLTMKEKEKYEFAISARNWAERYKSEEISQKWQELLYELHTDNKIA